MCFCLVFVWCVSVFDSFWMFGGAFARISLATHCCPHTHTHTHMLFCPAPRPHQPVARRAPRGVLARAPGWRGAGHGWPVCFCWAREQLDNWALNAVIDAVAREIVPEHRRHRLLRPYKAGSAAVGLFAPPEEAAINPLAGQHGRGWLRPEAPWRGGTAGPPVAPGQAPCELAEGLAACLAG